jgi:hypothetical protein
MTPGGTGQPDDGVAVDADEAPGLSDAVAFSEMIEDGSGLLVGHTAVEQRGAFALGEAGLAGVAIEQADVVVLAVAIAGGEVSITPSPIGGTVGVLAAEARKIIQSDWASRPAGWVNVQGLGSELLDILRCLIAFCSVIQGHHLSVQDQINACGDPFVIVSRIHSPPRSGFSKEAGSSSVAAAATPSGRTRIQGIDAATLATRTASAGGAKLGMPVVSF